MSTASRATARGESVARGASWSGFALSVGGVRGTIAPVECKRALSILSPLIAALGCQSSTPTQILVLVDSDLEVPGELSGVEVEVDVEGGDSLRKTFMLSLSGCGDEACQLPLSFGIAPPDGNEEARVTARIKGTVSSMTARTPPTRVVETNFVRGRSMFLPVVLSRDCVDRTCPEARSCEAGQCRPAYVNPQQLTDVPGDSDAPLPWVRPGVSSATDAGSPADADRPRDSGADAGVVPPRDAAAGSEDARSNPRDASTPSGNPDATTFPDALPMSGGPEWVLSVPAQVYFWRTEVTAGEYSACVSDGACSAAPSTRSLGNFARGRPDHPMNYVQLTEAEQFCQWVGGRLPTDDEWLAEATNNGAYAYPWGNDAPSCAHANHRDCLSGTDTVCSTPSGMSVSGLCDMGGNVLEILMDSPSSAPDFRWTRGGSYLSETNRLANMDNRSVINETSTHISGYAGFRCVRTSPP